VQSPPPSPLASPSPTGPYGYVVCPSPPPDGPQQIYEIDLNDKVEHVGGQFTLRVITSPDVYQLQVRAMNRIVAVPQTGTGLFSAEQQIPRGIPFFFVNRWYNVDFIATGQDGRSTTVTVPVRLEH
jgi:hypothetical protein